MLAVRGAHALGTHAHRIVSLDLAWNDLTADSVEALVKGLVAMQGAFVFSKPRV